MKYPRLVYAFALLCLAGVSYAQTAPEWNEDRVRWAAPTTCNTGVPIAACPVTGYRVQTAATQTSATWSNLADVPATQLTYMVTNVAPGNHCYRVLSISAAGVSSASSVSCTVTVQPLPGPPTNVTVDDPIAYDVRPNESTFAFERGRAVGTAKLGAACDEARRIAGDYYALERPGRVALTRTPRSAALVAHCS